MRPPGRLGKALALAFGVTWLAVLIRWWPMTQFAVWGSDQGEYASLMESFMRSGGQLPSNYQGWGTGYPDFAGMYSLAGTFAAIAGVDSFVALSIVVPAAAGLTALMTFAITLRLSQSLRASTLAGAIVAFAMPEAFAGSHGMPGALGGLFFVGALLAVAVAARSPAARWVTIIAVVALVPTHHLSAYMVALALSLVALAEARLGPADLARSRIVDSAFAGASAAALLSTFFWAIGAPHFRAGILDPISRTLALALPGAALLGMVALMVLIWWMEERPRLARSRLSLADEGKTLSRLGIAVLSAVATVVVVATIGVPGTSAVVDPVVALSFLPLAVVLACAAGGPGRLAPARGSTVPFAAAGAILLGALFGALTVPTILLPYRHMQYFVEAAAPLAAVALAFAARSVALTVLPERPRVHRPLFAILLALLVASCAISTYPEKSALGGFQEGTTSWEIASVVWYTSFVPRHTIVSDHRLSSLVFGFSNQKATWDSGGPVFYGNSTTALAALSNVATPTGPSSASSVLITEDIIQGAALSQWAPALPITGDALLKFEHRPFIKAFDNGDAVVYWVAK